MSRSNTMSTGGTPLEMTSSSSSSSSTFRLNSFSSLRQRTMTSVPGDTDTQSHRDKPARPRQSQSPRGKATRGVKVRTGQSAHLGARDLKTDSTKLLFKKKYTTRKQRNANERSNEMPHYGLLNKQQPRLQTSSNDYRECACVFPSVHPTTKHPTLEYCPERSRHACTVSLQG